MSADNDKIHNLFYTMLINDPVKVMLVAVDEIDIDIALNMPYKDAHLLTPSQKIMLFQDRKLSAIKHRDILKIREDNNLTYNEAIEQYEMEQRI